MIRERRSISIKKNEDEENMSDNKHYGGWARVPVYIGSKSYDHWKLELKAMQLVTSTGKKKQFVTVVLSSPERSK